MDTALKDEVVSGSTYFASTKPVSKTKLWHMRFSHVSERGLVELGKQNLLGGDKDDNLEFVNLVYLVNPVG